MCWIVGGGKNREKYNCVYYSAKQIWKLDSCKTFIVFSTNKGLKSISECKKGKIGGEPLIIIN